MILLFVDINYYPRELFFYSYPIIDGLIINQLNQQFLWPLAMPKASEGLRYICSSLPDSTMLATQRAVKKVELWQHVTAG